MLSRVADSLYWMSRYLERAEHTARLVNVYINASLDHTPGISEHVRRDWLLRSLRFPDDLDGAHFDDYTLMHILTFDAGCDPSIISNLRASRENARQVREQLSSEMWTQLNRLYLEVRNSDIRRVWQQPQAFFNMVKDGSHLFQGLTDATMNHHQGWHFIQAGRYIERVLATTTLLDVHLGKFNAARPRLAGGEAYFEWLVLLKSATAFEAYSKVYHADLRPEWIAEFLLFNPHCPRSVRFSVEHLLTSLEAIAEDTMTYRNKRLNRLAGKLKAALNYDDIGEVLSGDLCTYLDDIKHQARQIHEALYHTYITYTIEAAIP
jgi:uncharacterized alpha-E superfamily protein